VATILTSLPTNPCAVTVTHEENSNDVAHENGPQSRCSVVDTYSLVAHAVTRLVGMRMTGGRAHAPSPARWPSIASTAEGRVHRHRVGDRHTLHVGRSPISPLGIAACARELRDVLIHPARGDGLMSADVTPGP